MSTLSVHRLENVQDFDMANTPFVTAFNAANGAYAATNAAFLASNTSFAVTNTAYNFANTVNTFAYGVAVNSAAAFAAANNVGPQIAPTFNTANAAFNTANAAFNSANNVAPQVTPSFNTANAAFNTANAAFASANNVAPQVTPAFQTANNAYLNSNAAFNAANTKFSSSGGTISGAVEINASLTVHGNTIFVDQTTLSVGDPLIYLAANNYASDVVDIGFIANYVNATSSNVHTGLFRSSGTKEYYLFQGYDKEPYNNYIDPTGNNITMAVLNSTVRTSNLILGGANALGTIAAVYGTTNTAYASINSNWTVTNTAYGVANSAYNAANNVNLSAPYNTANAAFAKANSALQNTNVTLAGNLTSTGAITLNKFPFYESTANINFDYTINTGMNAFTPGPVAIANGVYVTIPDGSYWSVT